jgi:hypothetical protein
MNMDGLKVSSRKVTAKLGKSVSDWGGLQPDSTPIVKKKLLGEVKRSVSNAAMALRINRGLGGESPIKKKLDKRRLKYRGF